MIQLSQNIWKEILGQSLINWTPMPDLLYVEMKCIQKYRYFTFIILFPLKTGFFNGVKTPINVYYPTSPIVKWKQLLEKSYTRQTLSNNRFINNLVTCVSLLHGHFLLVWAWNTGFTVYAKWFVYHLNLKVFMALDYMLWIVVGKTYESWWFSVIYRME